MPTTQLARSADNVPIAYSVDGEGPIALVFVHGWCCDRSFWAGQVEHFRDRFTTISLDLGGHGESGAQRQRWSMAAYGGDVAAVIEQAGAQRVVLIGHSMAGEVIVEAAQRVPDAVIGLVGVDTLWNVARDISPEEFDNLLTPFQKDYAEAAEAYVRAMFLPQSDVDLMERVVALMTAVPSAVGLGSLQEILTSRPALRVGLRRLKAPMTLINSCDWRDTNLEATDAYGMHVEHIRGVGHFAMLEDPSTLNELLSAAIVRHIGD